MNGMNMLDIYLDPDCEEIDPECLCDTCNQDMEWFSKHSAWKCANCEEWIDYIDLLEAAQCQ